LLRLAQLPLVSNDIAEHTNTLLLCLLTRSLTSVQRQDGLVARVIVCPCQ